MSKILKNRAVEVTPEWDWIRKVSTRLSRLPGVERIQYREDGTIQLRYDLRKVRLEDIEEDIESLGLKLRNGFWSRLKRGFVHYTEQNEFDNLTAPELPCCSNPKLDR